MSALSDLAKAWKELISDKVLVEHINAYGTDIVKHKGEFC